MREKSVSQADRMLARQLSRRLRGSFQRTQSFESRGSLPRIFRTRTTHSNILSGDLPELLDTMLPTLSPNTDTGRNTPNQEANRNALAVTAV